MTLTSDLTDNAPVSTVLLFADISGYTRYIKDNPFTAAHALGAISALLDAVIDSLAPAFLLSKLEGDAAFCYASPASLLSAATGLETLLLDSVAAFDRRKSALIATNSCRCLACKSLDRLELKIILHQGEVLHFATRHSLELGGLPVIYLHRLSKNQVKAAKYILWTDAMAPFLAAFQPIEHSMERCDDLGPVKVHIYRALPGPASLPRVSAWQKMRDSIGKALSWLPLNLQGKAGKAAAFVDRADQRSTSGI